MPACEKEGEGGQEGGLCILRLGDKQINSHQRGLDTELQLGANADCYRAYRIGGGRNASGWTSKLDVCIHVGM